MANGRVITGYSFPKYSTYTQDSTTHEWASGTAAALARGVDVNITIEAADAITFYADNGIAECLAPTFTTGTLALTVDGLKDTARRAIFGMPASPTGDWEAFTNTTKADYVAVGFIVRFVEDSTTTYVPIVLPKVLFKPNAMAAATQGESIEFQTETLEGTIYLTSENIWKYVGMSTYSTEASAESALATKLADLTL